MHFYITYYFNCAIAALLADGVYIKRVVFSPFYTK